MKCLRCAEEMNMLNNVDTKEIDGHYSVGNPSNSNYYGLKLFARKKAKGFKKIIGNGIEELRIEPTLHCCKNCGYIEYVLSKKQLQIINEVENDDNYKKGNY